MDKNKTDNRLIIILYIFMDKKPIWKGEVVMPGKVRVIPPKISEPVKHVVIYARVSSNSMEQLESLKAQISGLVGFTYYFQTGRA